MPRSRLKLKSGAGFTLLEVLVAIFIITAGIGGVLVLANQSVVTASINSQKLTAAYFAQEGLELARNYRDTNWLEGEGWLIGLASGQWRTDMTRRGMISDVSYYLCRTSGFGVESFFHYGSRADCAITEWQRTIFRRTIILSQDPDANPATNDLRVQSQVTWAERGRSHAVTAEEILYDWR